MLYKLIAWLRGFGARKKAQADAELTRRLVKEGRG